MINAATVTVAILTKLQADATLLALMPDGVWFAEAPPGSTRFVIVSLIDMANVPMFGGVAFKDGQYLIEARALSTSGGDVAAAYDRITVLLTDASLTIAGYGVMLMQFEADTELTEVDDADPDIRWLRCGGQLHVMVAPAV